jgi:hypothetical protein
MKRIMTVQQSGPPPGNYRARFQGIENTSHPEYGAGVRFLFEVVAGAHSGRRVSRVTSCTPTLSNSAGRMLAGIVGRPLQHDEQVDIDRFVGRHYAIVVEAAPSGGTRVAALMPAIDT